MKLNRRHSITPREQELLNLLEVIRRAGERITITGFARRAEYSNKSALRHFPTLKKELADYVEQFTPHASTRGRTSSFRALEAQVERLERELRRREKQLERIPTLEGKVTTLEQEKTLLLARQAALRGMLSTVLAFMTENHIESAANIETRLVALATTLINGEDLDASEEELIPGNIGRTAPRLVSQSV